MDGICSEDSEIEEERAGPTRSFSISESSEQRPPGGGPGPTGGGPEQEDRGGDPGR